MIKITIIAIPLLCAGCASVTVRDGSGFEVKRMSYPFSSSKLNSFSMVVDTNGVRTIRVSGYGYESQDSINSMAASFAQGFVAGMGANKP